MLLEVETFFCESKDLSTNALLDNDSLVYVHLQQSVLLFPQLKDHPL